MCRIDTHVELWPLLVVVVPPRFNLEDVEVFTREVDSLYLRRERFASLIDVTALESLPSSAIRHALGDWQNRTIESIATYNVVTATVVRSPLARGAMTAMNWVFRPPNEQVLVATAEEAFQLAIDRLRSAHVELSPALEALAIGATIDRVEDLFSARDVA